MLPSDKTKELSEYKPLTLYIKKDIIKKLRSIARNKNISLSKLMQEEVFLDYINKQGYNIDDYIQELEEGKKKQNGSN